MEVNQPELLRSAKQHARRAKRKSGRIVVSAIGFGLAYYLDPENGAARRTRLAHMMHRRARQIDAVIRPEAHDAPPKFAPILRSVAEEPPPSGISKMPAGQ